MKQHRLKCASRGACSSSGRSACKAPAWILGLLLLSAIQCRNADGVHVEGSAVTVQAGIVQKKNGDPGKVVAATGQPAPVICSCPSTGHVPGCAAVEFFPVKKTSPGGDLKSRLKTRKALVK